jgi:hypothetical protein
MSQVDLEALEVRVAWFLRNAGKGRSDYAGEAEAFFQDRLALPALLEEVRAGRELDRLREAALAYGAAANDENSTPSARHWLREQLCDAARALAAKGTP